MTRLITVRVFGLCTLLLENLTRLQHVDLPYDCLALPDSTFSFAIFPAAAEAWTTDEAAALEKAKQWTAQYAMPVTTTPSEEAAAGSSSS
jgi:hypothetical protein